MAELARRKRRGVADEPLQPAAENGVDGFPALIDEAKAISAVHTVEYEPLDEPVLNESDKLGFAETLRGGVVDGVHLRRSFMNETFGGGCLENVPGFDATPALSMLVGQPGLVDFPQMSHHDLALTPRTESVIGPDTRRPAPNTAALPWRCVARLDILYSSGRTGRGTAWFIGPRTLVTAAHCLYHEEAKGASRIVVTPGYNRGAAPYGQFSVVASLWNKGWAEGFSDVLDFALIYLDRPANVGWFGFAAAPDPNLKRVLVNVAGYPDDLVATQWYDAGRIAALDPQFIHHGIDTEVGQSGAPLFWTDRVQRIGLGIHTYGKGAGSSYNKARRITPELFQLFGENIR